MKITKSEKIIIITLAIIIFSTLAYLNLTSRIDLEAVVNFLKIPGLIIAVFLGITLNILQVKGKFGSSNHPYAKQLTILKDEPILLDLGYRFILRLTSYKLPILYIFSKTLVTKDRLNFRFTPLLPFPTYSLFFNSEYKGSGIMNATHVERYDIHERSINIHTNDSEFIKIFAPKEKLSEFEKILQSNLRISDK